MSQGDSIYDFVDKRDHAVWKSNLVIHAGRTANTTYAARRYDSSGGRHHVTSSVVDSCDRTFYCRMYRTRSCRLPPASTEQKVRNFIALTISCGQRNKGVILTGPGSVWFGLVRNRSDFDSPVQRTANAFTVRFATKVNRAHEQLQYGGGRVYAKITKL